LLVRHPFIRFSITLHPQLLRTWCSGHSLSFHVHAPGDTVFEASRAAEHAYVLAGGCIRYKKSVPDDCEATMSDVEWTISSSGAWLAEVALWFQWTHVGTADVKGVTEVLAIDAKELLCGLNDCPSTRRGLTNFGMAYMRHMGDMPPDELEFVDDVSERFDVTEAMLVEMPRDQRVAMGYACVAALGEQWIWALKKHLLSELSTEVDEGRSILMFAESGEVHRFIQLAVVRLLREDGRLLAQVGEIDNGVAEPVIRLPATKFREGETTRTALQRLLQEDLRFFQPHLSLGQIESRTELTDSTRYGVQTKYIKKIQTATLDKADCVTERPVPQGPPSVSAERWTFESPRKSYSEGSLNLAHVQYRRSGSKTSVRSKEMFPKKIIALPGGRGRVNLYAWLREDEIASLASSHANRDIKLWLNGAGSAAYWVSQASQFSSGEAPAVEVFSV